MGGKRSREGSREGGERMTLAELKIEIAKLGIPFSYGYFEGEQPPKYIVYQESLRNVIWADGVPVYSEPWIVLYLISKNRDLVAESAIYQMLMGNKVPFDDPEYVFDEEQRLHIVTFNFSIGG